MIHAPHHRPIELADPLIKYGPPSAGDNTSSTCPTAIYVTVPAVTPHPVVAGHSADAVSEPIIPLPPIDTYTHPEPETETRMPTSTTDAMSKRWFTQDPLQAPLFQLTTATATADDLVPWTTKGTWTTKGVAAKMTPISPPTMSSPSISGSEWTLTQVDLRSQS